MSSSLKKSRSNPEPVSGSSRPAQPPVLTPAPPPAVPVVYTPRPPIPTPDAPREDLTERLRKEFGLSIEDSEEGEEGSDTEPLVAGGGPDMVSSFVSANSLARPTTNHVGSNNSGGQHHLLVVEGSNSTDNTNHGWSSAASRGSSGTPNHGSQPRSGSSGHSSPGGSGSSSYWGDVTYRNSFRQT